MDARQIRVAAVDEHAIVLEAIAARIGDQDDMILIAAETSGRRGLEALAEGKPDVAVIAIPRSDMNGLALVERIVNDHPAVKVVILSMHEDCALVQQALQIGARAYVFKRSPMEHLLQAIAAVAEGALYVDSAIASKIFRSPGNNLSSRQSPRNANSNPSLTKREADTVRLIALGYTAKEIAAQLSISAKTVETVKSRASKKLDLRTRVQLVRYAAIRGWLETVITRGTLYRPIDQP